MRFDREMLAKALAAWGMLAGVLVFAAAPAPQDAARSITEALRGNRFQEALDLAQSALKVTPREVRLLVLEGMALQGLRRDEEALAPLKTALSLSPDYVPALEAAAEIEYRLNRPEAVTHLQRLLVLRPGEPTAHAMLGALAWKRSDCAAAIEHFRQAKSVIASQPDALREYGACLLKAKRAPEAAEVFQQL